MKSLRRILILTPILGSIYLFMIRCKIGVNYFGRALAKFVLWLFKSRETTNYTYNLKPYNKQYLASIVAYITNVEYSTVLGYIKEIENDKALQKHIAEAIQKSEFSYEADTEVRYGRRIGWYLFARALKPKVIIETGVDKGLGSCVLTLALKRNEEEGFEGRYYGTDINLQAGYLLSGEYLNYGQILYGDSITSLKEFEGTVGLFINDSDHSAEYEAEEYEAIAGKLSEHAVILGDNSHVTDKLFAFSMKNNRHFIFFQEQPQRYWHHGAGIGISFN